VLIAPSPAYALKPAMHRSLAEAACKAQHLPDAFCRRMGKAVYETDAEEWDDLAAHAQRANGQSRCDAADAAANRIDGLAHSMLAAAASRDLETAAIDLGRALHTLQDECAHHGMSNPEHAFYSLTQTCSDQDVSPDTQPAAITCATDRTKAAMQLAASALAGTSWTNVSQLCPPTTNNNHGNNNNQNDCSLSVLPTPFQACDFLATYRDWDGGDSTWNADIVGAALLDAWAVGLTSAPASHTVCGGDLAAIDPPAPVADVINHDVSCALTNLTCLGKVDGGGTDFDPYGDRLDAGCSTGGTPGWLALALVVLVAPRRRSRAR
jgi:MYXO-CTERM domain-containing protein